MLLLSVNAERHKQQDVARAKDIAFTYEHLFIIFNRV